MGHLDLALGNMTRKRCALSLRELRPTGTAGTSPAERGSRASRIAAMRRNRRGGDPGDSSHQRQTGRLKEATRWC